MDRRDTLRSFIEAYADTRALPAHAVKEFLREAGLPVPRGLFIANGSAIPD